MVLKFYTKISESILDENIIEILRFHSCKRSFVRFYDTVNVVVDGISKFMRSKFSLNDLLMLRYDGQFKENSIVSFECLENPRITSIMHTF